jgi:hypothetical protein
LFGAATVTANRVKASTMTMMYLLPFWLRGSDVIVSM